MPDNTRPDKQSYSVRYNSSTAVAAGDDNYRYSCDKVFSARSGGLQTIFFSYFNILRFWLLHYYLLNNRIYCKPEP